MIKNKDRTPVAQDLVTGCTRCKIDTSHVVVFHNQEGFVERVKCKTCGSEHRYRPEKKVAPAGTIENRKRRVIKKEDYSKEFDRLADKLSGKEPVTYNMSGSFKTDEVISHRTFGMGIVKSVSYQKMEVAFREGLRILACDK